MKETFFDPKQLYLYLEEIHNLNLTSLDSIPAEKLDYKPSREIYSLKDLFKHMYANQKFYLTTAKLGKMNISDYKRLMAESPETKQDLQKYIQSTFAETKELFKDEKILSKKVSTIAGIRSVFHLFLGELEHQIHHRAQIYTYLRMLGIKPPDSGYFMGIE
ncbi:MAG: hypothetical protein A2145_04950 [candidate division Zixibacteria bacterium RBG_16_40_9]|nr:MAG: hypothetical protein A2145_04950 [candidate division Zixibacteria bacterium RBG_16_40_9]